MHGANKKAQEIIDKSKSILDPFKLMNSRRFYLEIEKKKIIHYFCFSLIILILNFIKNYMSELEESCIKLLKFSGSNFVNIL